jgi:subtilisin family serine protease
LRSSARTGAAATLATTLFRWLATALFAGVLLALSPGAGSASRAGARIVVGYTEQSFPAADRLEQALGAARLARLEPLRADVLRLESSDPQGALAFLGADPHVRYAEVDGLVHAFRIPNDELLSTQWSIAKTRAEQAWDLTTGAPQVVIGVLDTGVDPTQPDLQGKLVQGYDYVNNDQDPSDDNGHGTAVAGIVAANSDNGIGVAGYCWACRLMPVKVLDADGTGFMSAVAQGMIWASDHGARVLNLSLGGPDQDMTIAAATQYAQAHGVLVVAAAGNESGLTLDYPAALPNVLSVGASDPNDRLYSFSNSTARVAAPGENSTTARGGGYVSFLGTSSAAPVVSGIAGLAFSLVPGAAPAEVERALEATAVPIPGVVAGRVDAYTALRALAPYTPLPAPGSSGGSAPSGTSQPASQTGAAARTTKIVSGTFGRGRRARLVLETGSGALRATLNAGKAGRRIVRLRLFAAGDLAASARGIGRARLQARVRPGTYRLVADTSSRRRLAFTLTVSYPRP